MLVLSLLSLSIKCFNFSRSLSSCAAVAIFCKRHANEFHMMHKLYTLCALFIQISLNTNGHYETQIQTLKLSTRTRTFISIFETERMREKEKAKKSKNNQFNLCRLAHVFRILFSFAIFSSPIWFFKWCLCVWRWRSHNNWNITTSETKRWDEMTTMTTTTTSVWRRIGSVVWEILFSFQVQNAE